MSGADTPGRGVAGDNVITGTLPDGTGYRAPAAMAVHVSNSGEVVPLDEYVNTAQLGPLFAALA